MQEIIIHTDGVEKPSEKNTFYENRKNTTYLEEPDIEVSVCIMAYNRLEKTKQCVESVLQYTKDINYILVLIDNGSSDGTYEYYQSVPYENKQLIKLTKNISGVFGSNQVLKYIKTKYYALLGNDTIVTKDWLKNMLLCMNSDDTIGMVSPLATNTIDSQLPSIPEYDSIEELQEIAADFNKSDPRKWEERYRVIPIITLYRMEIFDIAGKYDPGFYHEFNEDDHEMRLRRNGYKVMLCGDTFIHHNHPYSERNDLAVRLQATASGRRNYYDKYAGIDAWDDIDNHVIQHLEGIEVRCESGKPQILGIDTKCGTPILDIKNLYRRNGIFESERYALTTKAKYYPDLVTVCSDVQVGEIEQLRAKYEPESFDAIVMGEPINFYRNPLKVLTETVSLLKKGGMLLFPLRNNYDIKAFLNLFGKMELLEIDQPTQIHYIEMVNKLAELDVENVRVSASNHGLDMSFVKAIRQLYRNIGIAENPEEEFGKLLIEDYWFHLERRK